MVDELPLVVECYAQPFWLGLGDAGSQAGGRERLGSGRLFCVGGRSGSRLGSDARRSFGGTGRWASVQSASVNTPSLDAITEFTVDTNGYKAEYGRASGGVMSFTSKSGTNDLHGTVYEFIRNDAFDARRFFEAKKGVYKQHDFGWSVGGPVWIPKLYNGRNKTFFFSSMEWFRNRVGATSDFFSVPTPEMYRGDFSNWVDNNGNKLPSTIPTRLDRIQMVLGLSAIRFQETLFPRTGFRVLPRP